VYLPEFTYHRPRTLDEALELKVASEGSSWYVGGTELVALMKLGLASPSAVIDLKAIRELRELAMVDGDLRIGAAVTHRAIERHPEVAATLPVLRDVEHIVGNVRVRNVGSLGGNLCFAEPHSDPAPLLLALDAQVRLVSSRGEREVPLAGFTIGAFETALATDEVMTTIRIPRPARVRDAAVGRRAFRERPTVNVILLELDDGFRVTVGSAGPLAVRAPEAEQILDECRGDRDALLEASRSAGESAAAVAGAYDEPGASTAYKEQLTAVLTDRAVRELASRAT
jgi:carbon-monoxide dehydrogenase medium subunit